MIGLLWLKLLNKEIEQATPKNKSLDEIYPMVQQFKKQMVNVNNFQLIEMLLDLENCATLQLENVILEFDQWIIIVIKKQEELISSGAEYGRGSPKNTDNGAFGEMNKEVSEEYQYGERGNEGEQGEIIKKNLTNNLTSSKSGK